MTRAAIKNAFRKLDAAEQAVVLKDLVSALADSLADEDAADQLTFEKRKHEEEKGRPWAQVRARLKAHAGKRRSLR